MHQCTKMSEREKNWGGGNHFRDHMTVLLAKVVESADKLRIRKWL